MWFARSIGALAVALLGSGCIEYLDSGQIGEARYFGEVRGEAPMRLLPPATDREGNVYVLFGAFDQNFVEVYVGHRTGGWSSGCDLHKGDDRGAHGWLGRDLDRAWYWSGDAVIEVSGRTGGCSRVLDRDPASNANLLFEGALPIVRETPSRTFTVGLIQSPSDRLPFFVVIDLDIQRYTSVTPFEPSDAENLVVLGVGAADDGDEGYMVVRYQRGGATVVEGLFIDLDGRITGRATITGADAIAEDGIAGYMHSKNGDVVVGLVRATNTTPAQLLVFDRRTGTGDVNGVGDFGAIGLHGFESELFLVGSNGSSPGVAALSATGTFDSPVVWRSSEEFGDSISGSLRILDDRSDPRRAVRWDDVRSAIGPFPFVSEHSPDDYAIGTTGRLLAGPMFSVSGDPQTSVAFVPVGISYP